MSDVSIAIALLALNLVFGAASAYAASRWGREPFGWLLLGVVLGPIGFILLVVMHLDDSRRARPSSGVHRPKPQARGGRRVLVPTDGSVYSVKAVRHVIDHFAAAMPAEVTVLSVLPLEMADSMTKADDSPRRRQLEEEMRNQAGGACASLRAAGIACTEAVRFGDPADEILKLAEEAAVDFIVMGRRGRGPVARLLLGSVSEKVAREASCPVTVVG